MIIMELKDGEPCGHRGCLSHVTHPCEGCGRIAGHRAEPTSCQHRLTDARNLVVKSGYVCVDCGALFGAADHDTPTSEPVITHAMVYAFHNAISDGAIGQEDFLDIETGLKAALCNYEPQPCSRCADLEKQLGAAKSLLREGRYEELYAEYTALEAEIERLHYFPKNDVFKTAELILSDCGYSTGRSALLEKVRSRLFAMFDTALARKVERIEELEAQLKELESWQRSRDAEERGKLRETIQQQATVIELCEKALEKIVPADFDGTGDWLVRGKALAAIKAKRGLQG